MKVSLNWLREFLPLEQEVGALSDLLTFAGIEVEGIENRGVDIAQVVVAQIVSSEQHPNADRLSVCRVEDGSGQPRQIVCGAKNYVVGDKVPLALPGAVLPGDFKIKVGKLRGVESEGMLCSAKELGISEESAGLLILSPEAEIGTPIGKLFPANTIFDLEITPNRPDLLSHYGIARELGAILGCPIPLSSPAEETLTGGAVLPVRIESAACSFYSGRIVRAVKVGPSPDWLAQKLQSVGLRPVNNVVDVTNLVMLETGQPLHAFDLARIDSEIVVRSATPGEKIVALDGREYLLDPDDLVIADASRPLAIAGVMGGKESGVVDQTRDVLIESALFAPANIRRTSRRLVLSSDSSYRFERGVDPSQVLAASARACLLLEEISGGQADDASLAGEMPRLERVVSLRNDRGRKLLGSEIPDHRIEEILRGLGLEKLPGNNWKIPSFRGDLTREVDLIEEIARVHGIQNVPAQSDGFSAPFSDVDLLYDFQISLKRILAARGFSEARTLSLRPLRELAFRTDAAIHIRNPLTEDQTAFRESMIPGLLAVAEFNQRMGAPSIRLQETGRIFRRGDNEETTTLGLLISGVTGIHNWRDRPEELDFFSLKADLAGLVSIPLEFVKAPQSVADLAADIFLAGQQIGWIGQLSPVLVREAGVKGAVFVAELEISRLFSLLPKGRKFFPLPRYPSVHRDVALLAPQALVNSEIIAALRGADEPLLREVDLFDLFTDPSGEKIAKDKKSLAYSLTYRADDRTLTQEEVNLAHGKLKAFLMGKCDVSLRE